MRRKQPRAGATHPPRDELRRELEHSGLAPEHAETLASQLARLAGVLPDREYRALLDGVRLGQRARRGPALPELHRLVEDFSVELQKVEEGLRLLSSILVRLRDHAGPESARTLH